MSCVGDQSFTLTDCTGTTASCSGDQSFLLGPCVFILQQSAGQNGPVSGFDVTWSANTIAGDFLFAVAAVNDIDIFTTISPPAAAPNGWHSAGRQTFPVFGPEILVEIFYTWGANSQASTGNWSASGGTKLAVLVAESSQVLSSSDPFDVALSHASSSGSAFQSMGDETGITLAGGCEIVLGGVAIYGNDTFTGGPPNPILGQTHTTNLSAAMLFQQGPLVVAGLPGCSTGGFSVSTFPHSYEYVGVAAAFKHIPALATCLGDQGFTLHFP